jgi:hypothetical protein
VWGIQCSIVILLTLTFHQNTTYVICEVRWRFNNVYQCTFLDETSEAEFYVEELIREKLSGEEFLTVIRLYHPPQHNNNKQNVQHFSFNFQLQIFRWKKLKWASSNTIYWQTNQKKQLLAYSHPLKSTISFPIIGIDLKTFFFIKRPTIRVREKKYI